MSERTFEEEAQVIKLKEESATRTVTFEMTEMRKLSQLQHENKMSQIRLESANRMMAERTKAELMAQQTELKKKNWQAR